MEFLYVYILAYNIKRRKSVTLDVKLSQQMEVVVRITRESFTEVNSCIYCSKQLDNSNSIASESTSGKLMKVHPKSSKYFTCVTSVHE